MLKKKNKHDIRIALFHCGFTYSGGGERIVLEEAKVLRKEGYHMEVWAPTLDAKKCYPTDVAQLQVRTFLPQLPRIIPFADAIDMITAALLAPFLAFRFSHIDVFVGENQPGAWIAFCMATVLRKPYLVYMNQPNRLLYPRKIDRDVQWQNLKGYNTVRQIVRHMRPLAELLDRVSFTSGTAMLVNGEYIGKTIERIYRKKGILCPAATHVAQKARLARPQDVFTGELSVMNAAGEEFMIAQPYILLTNRHVPQKKFSYAIEAMHAVVAKMPQVQLVIPGPYTEHTQALLRLVSRLHLEKNVVFTGQISEQTLQRLYRFAAVYVYTAPDEDFGMGIVEAMGWGVPVIAWNNGGPTVTVVHKKTGYLAKPYDIKDFARGILHILADKKLRTSLSKQAWERAHSYFSWETHVATLEKAIRASL